MNDFIKRVEYVLAQHTTDVIETLIGDIAHLRDTNPVAAAVITAASTVLAQRGWNMMVDIDEDGHHYPILWAETLVVEGLHEEDLDEVPF